MKENIRPPEEYVDQRGHSFCCQNDDIYAVAPLADSDIAINCVNHSNLVSVEYSCYQMEYSMSFTIEPKLRPTRMYKCRKSI